jgi:putative DNA primase/helicase
MGFGLYPEAKAMRQALAAEGCDLDVARKAGVLKNDFAGYILVPWSDDRGRPLTIYARYQAKEHPGGQSKTLALPGAGTKRSPLCLDRALRTSHRDLVAVEGIFDVTLLHARGDTRVISPVAAQFSERQVQTLVRHRIRSVTLCMDPDGGGVAGTRSCVLQLLRAGITPYVAPELPDGLDPDEFLIRYGMDAWRAHVSEPSHGLRWQAERLLEGLHDE